MQKTYVSKPGVIFDVSSGEETKSVVAGNTNDFTNTKNTFNTLIENQEELDPVTSSYMICKNNLHVLQAYSYNCERMINLGPFIVKLEYLDHRMSSINGIKKYENGINMSSIEPTITNNMYKDKIIPFIMQDTTKCFDLDEFYKLDAINYNMTLGGNNFESENNAWSAYGNTRVMNNFLFFLSFYIPNHNNSTFINYSTTDFVWNFGRSAVNLIPKVAISRYYKNGWPYIHDRLKFYRENPNKLQYPSDIKYKDIETLDEKKK